MGKADWKTPRGAVDPGGPCPHCVAPVDPELAKRRLGVIEALTKSITDPTALQAALGSVSLMTDQVCPFCQNKRFVRVCATCDGHGREKHLGKTMAGRVTQVEADIELHPAVYSQEPPGSPHPPRLLKPAVMGRGMVDVHETFEQDAWFDGATCATCKGTGLVGIAASEVGHG